MLPIFRGFDRLLLTEDYWQKCSVQIFALNHNHSRQSDRCWRWQETTLNSYNELPTGDVVELPFASKPDGIDYIVW